jgi:hypothetical protein
MAVFPVLMPVRREWEFPAFPTTDYEGTGGGTISFEFGSTPTDLPLTLVYELISEAEMQLIRDHYLGQQSVHHFSLPDVVLAGYGELDDVFLQHQSWLYVDEPEEKPRNFDLFDVKINLRSCRL